MLNTLFKLREGLKKSRGDIRTRLNYEMSGEVSYLGSICRFLFPFREKFKKKKGSSNYKKWEAKWKNSLHKV